MNLASLPSSTAAPKPRRPRPRRRTWIIWALGFAAIGPLGLVLLAAAGIFGIDAFLGELLWSVLWAMAAAFALNVAVISAFEREWRWMMLALVLPLSFALARWNDRDINSFGMGIGEYVHFRLMRSSYLAEIAALPSDKDPRTVVFVLSEDGWFAITNYHLVVYDESDEVALPDGERSASWKAKVADTALDYGVGYLRPLGDHFYIVRISH